MKIKEKIQIPRSKTYSELFIEVAKRLNNNQQLPFRGREYNIGIVQSHAYGKIKDQQVESMINQVANEWYAK